MARSPPDTWRKLANTLSGMFRFLLIPIAVGLLAPIEVASSCSMGAGYSLAKYDFDGVDTSPPSVPDIESFVVHRGDSENLNLCGALGIFSVKLGKKPSEHIAGFQFSVLTGDMPFHIPSWNVSPVETSDGDYVFVFTWSEANIKEGWVRPLAFVIAVSEVTVNGEVGPGIELSIEHPGF